MTFMCSRREHGGGFLADSFFSPYLVILDVIKFSMMTLRLILMIRMLLQFPAINIGVIELLSLPGVWFFTWAAVIKARLMPSLIWSQRIISRDINGHRIDRFLTAIILYHALSSWWMSTRYGIECQHFSAFRLHLAVGYNVWRIHKFCGNVIVFMRTVTIGTPVDCRIVHKTMFKIGAEKPVWKLRLQ